MVLSSIQNLCLEHKYEIFTNIRLTKMLIPEPRKITLNFNPCVEELKCMLDLVNILGPIMIYAGTSKCYLNPIMYL